MGKRTCRVITFGFLADVREETWSFAHLCRFKNSATQRDSKREREDLCAGSREERQGFFVVGTIVAIRDLINGCQPSAVTGWLSTVDFISDAASCVGPF